MKLKTYLSILFLALSFPLTGCGSSSGDENLNRCALNGISKINIYTDFLVAAKKAIDEGQPDNYLALKALAKQGMQQCLRHYYSVFATKEI